MPRSPLLVALAVVTGLWAAGFAHAARARHATVDDWLYAGMAEAQRHAWRTSPRAGLSAVLHTGEFAPLVPVVAAPASYGGVTGVIATQLAWMLLLTLAAYDLATRVTSPPRAAVVAVATAANAGMLGWSVVANFAPATTALTVCCFAAFLRSDGLRSLPWSALLGLAVGALALARSMAPVYVVPLVLVLSVVLVRRSDGRHPWPGLSLAAGTAGLVAAPWWLVSGPEALRYLRSAGYGETDFTSQEGSRWLALPQRIVWTVEELGSLQAALLVLGVVAALLLARGAMGTRERGIVTPMLSWAALTLLLLSTSSNVGTGFGLPVLVVVVMVTGLALANAGRTLRRTATVASAIALVAGAAALTGIRTPGARANLDDLALLQTGAASSVDTEETNAEVLAALGGRKTLLLRDDHVVNGNALEFLSPGTLLPVPRYDATATAHALELLKDAEALITGSTQAPFHRSLDVDVVEDAARSMSFRTVRVLTLGPGCVVEVWVRERG